MQISLTPLDAEYIVFRRSDSFPKKWMPDNLEGKWEYHPDKPCIYALYLENIGLPAVAKPTGDYEIREDGNVAQVYEVTFRG